MMKVLLVNSHTPYLYSLAQTGHEFYCVEDAPEVIEWQQWQDKVRPRPLNVKSIAYRDLDTGGFDVLILQNPMQWIARSIFPKLPIIYIEHNAQFRLRDHYVVGDGVLVIFNSERTEGTWIKKPGVNYRTIESGIPDDLSPYQGDEAVLLSVVHNFHSREAYTRFPLWQKVTMGFPWKVVGEGNEGIGEVAANWDSLRSEYARARVYLSVGVAFPGLADIEAAMTGMPLVRIKGVGQLVKDRELLKHYLDDKEAAVSEGQMWREWALEHHNIERFCSEWNEVLNSVR